MKFTITPEAEQCGAWMPVAKERCARRRGHGPDSARPNDQGHRTRYALDNARNRCDTAAGLRRRLGLATA